MKCRAVFSCLLLFAALASPADEAPSPTIGPTREAAQEQNPFRGLYDHIDDPALTANSYQQQVTDFLFRHFMQENPKADRRKAQLLAEVRSGARDAFPDSEPMVTKEEKEPLDELFRLINLSQKGKLGNKDTLNKLRELKLKYPSPCVTRGKIAEMIYEYSEGEQRDFNWRLIGREWQSLLKRKTFSKDDCLFMYNSLRHYCTDENWKELDDYYRTHPLDPWLRSMIAGWAGVFRAWDARGYGWASTVTKEGWEIFYRELGKAKEEFHNAIRIEPKRVNPYNPLIIVEKGTGSIDSRIETFREAIRLMPDYFPAYSELEASLIPRWGGSYELIFQLAEAAINTRRYDLDIPAAGFNAIGEIVRDCAWRWQNWYRRPGIPEKTDAYYAYLLEHRGGNWTTFILMHKMTFEMATLRYDRALETRKKIPLDDKAFHDYWGYNSWRGGTDSGSVPCMPTYYDPVPLLELFTGEHGAQLQAIERQYLDKDPNAGCIKLAEFIRTAKLAKDEKALLIDLYGRWLLQVGGEQYFDCQNYQKLYTPFQVAAGAGAGNVMAAMIGLGYDYSAFENYPGETAIIAARGEAAPELLDILKKAGDPLNRPEPEHGRTPLQAACFNDKPAIVKKLISLGCPVNAPDRENHTAFQLAAAKGGPELIGILLKAGADPDAKDNDGDTALMFAIENKQKRAVWEPTVLALKEINHRNNSGRTVLHYAAEYQVSPELVKLLLKRGADPKLKDNSGRTPADVARAKGNQALAKLLAP